MRRVWGSAGISEAQEQQATSSVHRLFLDKEVLPDEFHHYYHGASSVAEAAKAVRHRVSLWRHAGETPSGRDVLDVGCGFGIECVIDLALGARTARGVDFRPSRIEAIQSIPKLIPGASQLDAVVGKADALPFDDSTFDALTVASALSHFDNLDGFLHESRRVLKPDGLLLLEEDNNLLSPLTRRRNRAWWRKLEFGPREPNYLWDKPFAESRADVLERELGLSSGDARMLAERTVGLAPDAYREAGARFLADGTLPAFTLADAIERNRAPVDPFLGQPIEQMISPYELRDRLKSLGFGSVRVAGYWGGASGKRYLRVANAALTAASPLTIRTAYVFRVAAQRSP